MKQIWFVRYVIVRILPPFGSYAPVSPSLVPVNRLSYYLTFQSIFSLFFCILRFDHEVKPIGRPKRVFPARGGFLGVGRSQTDKSLSLSLSLVDGAVCGRSAAGQVRITEFSDYTSDQMADITFKRFHRS